MRIFSGTDKDFCFELNRWDLGEIAIAIKEGDGGLYVVRASDSVIVATLTLCDMAVIPMRSTPVAIESGGEYALMQHHPANTEEKR